MLDPLDRALTTLLSDGHWRTLKEIQWVTGGNLRDLTKRVYLLPGLVVRTRNEIGLAEYAVKKTCTSAGISLDAPGAAGYSTGT